MNYLERAMELAPSIVADRRHIHQNPELGMELPKTTEYVTKRLREIGLEPRPLAGGVTADIVGGKPGKTFLLRADMDALPMAEESGLPFASTVQRAHTCGHDMHTSMLLCAAQLLYENKENICGTVRLMFQPGEEICAGAKAMIAAGILDGVDAAMGAHMMPMAPIGMVAWNYGPTAASNDGFEILITGKGGHGAHPDLAVDPINVGAHLHIALQELIAREVDPAKQAVVTVGQFHAGDAPNIIPKTCSMSGTVRTFDNELRNFIMDRMKEVSELTAKTFRATAEFRRGPNTCALVIDKEVSEIVGAGLIELLGAKRAMRVDMRQSGSEDFGEVAAKVPSMFFVLGGGTPADGCNYSVHHPKVLFREECLPIGAAAYAQGATAWLAAKA